jgi:hypothetical protein
MDGVRLSTRTKLESRVSTIIDREDKYYTAGCV